MDNVRQVTMAEITPSCGVTPMTIDRHSRTGPALDHVTHQGMVVERDSVAGYGRPRGRRVAPAALSASRTKP